MSLKFFHLLFIGASSLMSLGVAVWAVSAWRTDGAASWLLLALLAVAGGLGLMARAIRPASSGGGAAQQPPLDEDAP